MPRRCTCSALMRALTTDPRLRSLPLAARAFWLLLAEAAEHLGGVIPFVGSARVSLLVSAPVTETETHLETLLAEGLLVRDGDSLVVPLLREAAEARAGRSAAAQANGRRGGRPRRGETPEEARLRRAQPSLVLPITGGRAETQETQAESSRASDSDLSDSQSQIGSDAREPLHEFAARCAEVVGLDPAKGAWTWQDVAAWRRQGLTDAEILDVLETVTRRTQAKGIKVGGFRYFQRAMDEALANRPAPAAPVSPETAAYLAQMAEWRIHRLGPPPIMQGRAVA